MAERPGPPEHAEELPQLTPEHWQLIAGLKFNDPKITQYAEAKAAALIDDEQEPYIGKRHWNAISDAASEITERVQTKIRFTPFTRQKKVQSEMGKQIMDFADGKAESTFTLNDIFEMRNNASIITYQGPHELDPGEVTENLWWDSDSWYHTYAGRKVYETEIPSDEFILKYFYLSEEEVLDPIHTSPDELMRLVRNIPETELIERSNISRVTGKILGWEKPIPQAHN